MDAQFTNELLCANNMKENLGILCRYLHSEGTSCGLSFEEEIIWGCASLAWLISFHELTPWLPASSPCLQGPGQSASGVGGGGVTEPCQPPGAGQPEWRCQESCG